MSKILPIIGTFLATIYLNKLSALYSLFSYIVTLIMCALFLLLVSYSSCRPFFTIFHSFSFVLLLLDNFKWLVFTNTFFYLLKCVIDTSYWNFHFFIVFYSSRISVFLKWFQLLILFMYCFPNFVELSFHVFLYFTKLPWYNILIILLGNCRSPFLWHWLLEKHYIPWRCHFSWVFNCFLKYCIAIFTSEKKLWTSDHLFLFFNLFWYH